MTGGGGGNGGGGGSSSGGSLSIKGPKGNFGAYRRGWNSHGSFLHGFRAFFSWMFSGVSLEESETSYNDMAILVAFPEDSPKIPDNQGFASWWERNFGNDNGKADGAGHAGIVIINGESGKTKYFDFGRYNRPGAGNRGKNQGSVRSSKYFDALKVPNWNFNRSNSYNVRNILSTLHRSSKLSGYGMIMGALATGVDGSSMLSYARTMEAKVYIPFGGYASSSGYGNATYCAAFARGIGAVGGINFDQSSFTGAANVMDVFAIYNSVFISIP